MSFVNLTGFVCNCHFLQLLTRLVFERGSTDAAGKVAEIMCADFVHEVISACVPPVYPPRSGHGWACIPVVPTFSKSSPESKMPSPTSREAKPGSYSRSSGTPGIPLYPLQLDILKHLVKLSSVRAILVSVFGSSILYRGGDPIVSNSLDDDSLKSPDADRLLTVSVFFSLDVIVIKLVLQLDCVLTSFCQFFLILVLFPFCCWLRSCHALAFCLLYLLSYFFSLLTMSRILFKPMNSQMASSRPLLFSFLELFLPVQFVGYLNASCPCFFQDFFFLKWSPLNSVHL